MLIFNTVSNISMRGKYFFYELTMMPTLYQSNMQSKIFLVLNMHPTETTVNR